MEEHTQNGKVQEGLSHKSSSRLIKTGSGVLRISEYSKSALEIRSSELGKVVQARKQRLMLVEMPRLENLARSVL